MLLSMFMSFLLVRKFRGKVYILLMTVALILISLFSIGVPSVWGTLEWHWLAAEYIGEETTIWQLNIPAIPLSFPFHISISRPIMAQLHDVLLPEYFRLHPLLPMYEISFYLHACIYPNNVIVKGIIREMTSTTHLHEYHVTKFYCNVENTHRNIENNRGANEDNVH